MADAVLSLSGVRKSYNPGTELETEVLHGIDFTLSRGELTALIGPSGSGKSTLLNLIGLLDTASGGELTLMGQPTAAMDDDGRTRLCNEAIGFVFPFHHLINAFTVLDNVLMPRMVRRGAPTTADRELALSLLREVGLEAFAQKKPSQLSGGAAAARGHRPRPGQRARPAAGRRAHRQSRHSYRRQRLRTLRATQS